MAEHAWTVLCQKVLTDDETKLPTLVDLFDRLIINPTPDIPDIAAKLEELQREGQHGIAVPTEMRIVTQWYRSERARPENAKCRVALVDPHEARIFEQEISIELTEKPLQRITVRSHQLGITGLGIYWVVVEKPKAGKGGKWAEVARIPLQVIASGTPA